MNYLSDWGTNFFFGLGSAIERPTSGKKVLVVSALW